MQRELKALMWHLFKPFIDAGGVHCFLLLVFVFGLLLYLFLSRFCIFWNNINLMSIT